MFAKYPTTYMQKFWEKESSNVVDPRYSLHKSRESRSGTKWKFQIINYFDDVVYEQGGFNTQVAARTAGMDYRNKNYPKAPSRRSRK